LTQKLSDYISTAHQELALGTLELHTGSVSLMSQHACYGADASTPGTIWSSVLSRIFVSVGTNNMLEPDKYTE